MARATRTLPSTTNCPRCGKLITIRSEACIYCGLRWPRIYISIPILNGLIRSRISFVDPITIACFALYLLALALDIEHSFAFKGLFESLAPSEINLYRLGAGGVIPMAAGRWWSLITANYLHGGIIHILFNMLWLRNISPLVEELYGASRFWIIYTVAGLSGAVLTTLMGTWLFVGASGAIFGLFGALIYYGLSRRGTFGSAILRQTLFYAVIGFVLGFTQRGVDNWGHLGGFLGGFGIAFFLSYQEKAKLKLGHHLAAFILVIFVALCFGFMAYSFFTAPSV